MQEQEYELDTRSNRGQTTVGVSCGYLVLWTRAGMQGGRLVAGALDRMPLDQDTMQTRTLTVWTPRVGTTATKALELPCHYRRGGSFRTCGRGSTSLIA